MSIFPRSFLISRVAGSSESALLSGRKSIETEHVVRLSNPRNCRPALYQIYRNRVQSSTRNLFSDVDFEGKAQSSRRKLTRVLKFNRKFNPSAVPFNCFYCKVVMILIYISANKIIFYLYIHITSDIIYTTQV